MHKTLVRLAMVLSIALSLALSIGTANAQPHDPSYLTPTQLAYLHHKFGKVLPDGVCGTISIKTLASAGPSAVDNGNYNLTVEFQAAYDSHDPLTWCAELRSNIHVTGHTSVFSQTIYAELGSNEENCGSTDCFSGQGGQQCRLLGN
ncbi:MAG: hypothetical protein OJF49_002113 [Ktedonobacterales bacterium]|jgi:hypothetical protein|nr:MAG: hypothetical protein OJF49_002113 [Ktedonobacterales bacterium]